MDDLASSYLEINVSAQVHDGDSVRAHLADKENSAPDGRRGPHQSYGVRSETHQVGTFCFSTASTHLPTCFCNQPHSCPRWPKVPPTCIQPVTEFPASLAENCIGVPRTVGTWRWNGHKVKQKSTPRWMTAATSSSGLLYFSWRL